MHKARNSSLLSSSHHLTNGWSWTKFDHQLSLSIMSLATEWGMGRRPLSSTSPCPKQCFGAVKYLKISSLTWHFYKYKEHLFFSETNITFQYILLSLSTLVTPQRNPTMCTYFASYITIVYITTWYSIYLKLTLWCLTSYSNLWLMEVAGR